MPSLPSHSEPLVNAQGRIAPAWLNYLRGVTAGDVDVSAAVAAIATALGSPDGSVAGIPRQTAATLRILSGAGISVYQNASGYVLNLTANTDLVPEGASLYFTDDRARAAVSRPAVAVPIVSGVATLDCALGRFFTLNLNANATLAIANPPSADCIILRVTQAGGFALTLPGYVTPRTGAYTTTASGTELIGLLTVDGTNFDAVVLK